MKLQSQSIKVGRYCAVNAEWDPSASVGGEEDVWRSLVGNKGAVGKSSSQIVAGGCVPVSVHSPPVPSVAENDSRAASSPTLSVQLPAPPLFVGSTAGLFPPEGPSFATICIGLNGPTGTPKEYDTLTYGASHQLRYGWGYAKKNSKSVVKTRLLAADALGRKRVRRTPDEVPDFPGKWNRVDALHHAFATEKAAVTQHAQRSDSPLRETLGRVDVFFTR